MIYRRTRHYAHNSTYISLFRNYMCNQQALVDWFTENIDYHRVPENFVSRTSCKNGDNCEDLLAAPDPEVYFEFDMCVWDFKSEAQSQNFLITKTICGFIVPFIIISVSYILIAFRKSSFDLSCDLRWPQWLQVTLSRPLKWTITERQNSNTIEMWEFPKQIQ